MSPPGLLADPQTSGSSTRAEATSQTQKRYEAACRLALSWNIGWSPMKVLKLVRRYEYAVESNGYTLFDFLVNAAKLTEDQRHEARAQALSDPDNLILLGYNDHPTGETAVNNVMRKRGF